MEGIPRVIHQRGDNLLQRRSARSLQIWKVKPAIEPAAIEKFQNILVQGGVLESGKRVKYSDIVVTDFATKAE